MSDSIWIDLGAYSVLGVLIGCCIAFTGGSVLMLPYSIVILPVGLFFIALTLFLLAFANSLADEERAREEAREAERLRRAEARRQRTPDEEERERSFQRETSSWHL